MSSIAAHHRAFGTKAAGPLNLLLWLSYFVMLGLYALAFGADPAALRGWTRTSPGGGCSPAQS
jgi:hypothetical protein